jgi:hypothetical protein
LFNFCNEKNKNEISAPISHLIYVQKSEYNPSVIITDYLIIEKMSN